MARKKKVSKWLTVTIPTSHLIFAAVGVLLLVLTILFMIFGNRYMDYRHRTYAHAALGKAETLLDQASENRIPEYDLVPPKTLIETAKTNFEAGDFRTARRNAEDAVQQLEFLLATFKPDEAGISGRFARIIELHGVVEILEPRQADWMNAGVNTILRSGTRVRTKPASTAKLKFDDGSIIQMKADSLILIRSLSEDERTMAKSSSIELGVSEIEAVIPEPRIRGSHFLITMPDSSQAKIDTESSLAVSVDDKRSVIKVFVGQVDILAGERKIALKTREAIVLDGRKSKRNEGLKPLSIPMPPRLIYPANVQLFSIREGSKDSIFFRWTIIKEAKKYQIDIATDYYFYEIIKSEKLSDNKATIKGLEVGNYYWRVSSITAENLISEASQFNSFRIAPAGDLESQEKDLTPPNIQIEHITLLGRIADIAGKTEPNARIFVNEQKEESRDDGSFRALIEFNTAGTQEILIEVYDSAGNVATITRDVTIPESAVR